MVLKKVLPGSSHVLRFTLREPVSRSRESPVSSAIIPMFFIASAQAEFLAFLPGPCAVSHMSV